MKFLLYHALIVLLGCIAIGGLLAFAANPLLYAVDKDSLSSISLEHPVAYEQRSVNSTTDVVPFMQNVIDYQMPVVLEIRSNNGGAAQKDLAEYNIKYGSLRDLVINLNIDDEEIKSFMINTKDQGEILSSLMTDASTLDALKNIEKREESRNDPNVQASVANQAESLRDKTHKLYARYLQDHAGVMKISTKVGLDTRQYEETPNELKKIVDEVDAVELPKVKIHKAPSENSNLTIYLEPEQAGYMETVYILGVVPPEMSEKPVSVLLSGSLITTPTTDQKGNFLTLYTVEHISAGKHTVSVRSENIPVVSKILTVLPVDSVTTLEESKLGRLNNTERGVVCSGSVMANHPVRDAPFEILVDERNIFHGKTDVVGTYLIFIPLDPGIHTLRAQFSSREYPVNPSQSGVLTVEIPDIPKSAWDDAIRIMLIVIIISGFMVAAVWYIRRRRSHPPSGVGLQKEPVEAARIREKLEQVIAEAERESPPAGSDRGAAISHAIGILLVQYEKSLNEHGLSDASRNAYLALAGRIAGRLHITKYRTMTPSEISKTCTNQKYSGIFARFVGIYEKIRYGGSDSEFDRAEFKEKLEKAESALDGDRY